MGLKNLEIIEREDLVGRVKTTNAARFAQMMQKFKDHPLVGEARSIGMMGALELVADKKTRARFADLGRVGLICRNHFIGNGFIMRAVYDTMICARR